jgi:hypothetical protein
LNTRLFLSTEKSKYFDLSELIGKFVINLVLMKPTRIAFANSYVINFQLCGQHPTFKILVIKDEKKSFTVHD